MKPDRPFLLAEPAPDVSAPDPTRARVDALGHVLRQAFSTDIYGYSTGPQRESPQPGDDLICLPAP